MAGLLMGEEWLVAWVHQKVSLELCMICINKSPPPTDTTCLTNGNTWDFNIVALDLQKVQCLNLPENMYYIYCL